MREKLTVACFFVIALSYKLAWTAISSLLSQLGSQHGPQILLQLNVAYFLPSIPVLILQTVFNESMDRRMGLSAAALLRFSLGLGGLVALSLHFPMLASISQTSLLGATALIGVCYGIAFGTSYQLASKFSPGCTIALTTGFVSSGPIVLALDLTIKQGAFYTDAEMSRLFTAVASLTLCGLMAAFLMVTISRRHFQMLAQQQAGGVYVRLDHKLQIGSSKGSHTMRDKLDAEHKYLVSRKTTGASDNGHHSAIMMDAMEGGGHAAAAAAAAAGGDRHLSGGGGGGDNNDKSKRGMRPLLLAWKIAPPMIAIFLSVGTSMLVFPFFTYMHSTGLLGDRLPQVLFYVRLIGDIAGRVVPRRLQSTSITSLMFWALFKCAMVPLVFMSIFHPEAMFGDAGAMLLVAVFWLLSGYLNTCAYLMAPKMVPTNQKPRASGMMTVAFQLSCFLALMLAAFVQKLATAAPVATQ